MIFENSAKDGAILTDESITRPAGPSLSTTTPIFEENATLEEVGGSTNALVQSNAEANCSMLSSSSAVLETESFPSDVEPSGGPVDLLEEPSVDPYEPALHVGSEASAEVDQISSQNQLSTNNATASILFEDIEQMPLSSAPSGDGHGDPKTLMLQEMMEAAESNLHRMLALADDLYEEEEEAHRMQHAGRNGTKRQNQRRRVPLRERVERMAERRRDEQSERGAEERKLRLERRRKQWEEAAAATTATAPANVTMSKANEKGAEGLGRKNAFSYEHQPLSATSLFDEEQNVWNNDIEVVEANLGSTSILSDQLIQGGGEMSSDIGLADTDDPNSSLSDLLVPDMESSEKTYNDESSNVMTATNSNEHQTTATEGPRTVQKPSLMDLLGDDFSFGPKSDDMRDSSKASKQQKKEEAYRPPSSLMDLLNENFNIPLEERGNDGANLALVDEQRPPGSLMDLLSENFSPREAFTTLLVDDVLDGEHIETAAKSMETRQSSDLLGLLDANDADGKDDSLMNLLDDDEKQIREADQAVFESGDSELSFGIETVDPNSTTSPSSLLDLLDADAAVGVKGAHSEQKETSDIHVKPGPSPTSLLSIIDDGISSSETSHEDGDLTDLLSTDYSADAWGSDDLAEEETTSTSEIVDELLSLLICATEKEWNEITNTSEPSLVEEAEREAGYLLEDENDTPPAKAMTVAEEILNGSNELNLKVDDINLALLNLAFLPPTLSSMELIVKIFKLMEDNRRSGDKNVVPNAATYALLMAAFGYRGNDHQAAKFVCQRMIKAMDMGGLILDGNVIAVGARCLRKVGDIANAEKLLSDSLGDAGSGVEVSPRVFNHALALYKEDNLQEDALKLLDVFINESVDGSQRKLDEFVKSLIRWPQRNRRGNRIALALHHQKILEYLEAHCIEEVGPDGPYRLTETSDRYKPSYFVWRELLRSLYRAARHESKGQFELVRRACRCLVNSSRDETHPDHFVLQAGLTAAEELGDAKLASDMILWAWENAEQFVEIPSHERSSYSSGPSEKPPPSLFGFETRENVHADLDAELDSLFGTASIDSPKDDEVHQGNEQAECHKQGDLLNSNAETSPSDLLSILDDPDPVAETSIEDFHSSTSNEAERFTEQEGKSNAFDTDWFHSEHESGPPRYFIHIPTKAYYSAIKICLAGREPELAHSILKAGCIGPSDEVDMRLPDSSRSHLFNLVMSGYSQIGAFENAKLLLDEMQSIGPRPTEHTYAAFITSLAMADKLDEATNVIDSMLRNENGDGILPGSSSFGACMLAALKAKAYQQVLDLNTKMIDAGISPNSQSYFGVVLASTRLGDRASALKAAESALESKLPINHQGLNLLLKALLPDSFGDGSIASVRSNLRSMGKEDKDIAQAANALSRSLRIVETEERRPKRTKNVEKCEQMWQICLRDLCALVHQKDGF